MSETEIAYRLSKKLVERLKPDQLESFDQIWESLSEERKTTTVKEKVLGLAGAELVGSLAWPIVVAVTGRLVADGLVHAAKSRRLSKEMRIEITKQSIIISNKWGVEPRKAREIIKKIIETLDSSQEIVDSAFYAVPT